MAGGLHWPPDIGQSAHDGFSRPPDVDRSWLAASTGRQTWGRVPTTATLGRQMSGRSWLTASTGRQTEGYVPTAASLNRQMWAGHR